MIKRIIGALAMPLIVVLLAACGSDSTPPGPPQTTNATSSVSTPTTSFPSTSQDVSEPSIEANEPSTASQPNDEAFLRAVRAKVPQVAQASDQALLNLGHTVCPAIDEGTSPIEAAKIILDAAPSITAYGAGYIVGAAIGAYCPENADQVPQ